MTREELRTLAALDVFGLLDEYESGLYTRSFHHASAAVQDEIIELQAAIAQNPPLLTVEEPRDELRSQVMLAVTNAMDSESRKFAPIASIGRNRARLNVEALQRHAHFRGVHYWRAATFVLAGALVAVAYFFADTVNRNQLVTEIALGTRTAEQAKGLLGNDFLYFLNNPDCQQIVLMPKEPENVAATGIVYINEKTQEAFLLTVGLPEDNQKYVLRVEHEDGTIEELKAFTPRPSIFGVRLDRISSSLLASAAHWQIASLEGTRVTVLLRSA
jgi:hypothetical protein